MKDTEGNDTPFLQSGAPTEQAPSASSPYDEATCVFCGVLCSTKELQRVCLKCEAGRQTLYEELESAIRDLSALYAQATNGQWPSSYVHKHAKVIKYLRETGT